MVAVLAESAILRVACGLGHDLAGHGADVRVVQAGDRLGFPLEPLAEIGIVGDMRQEHLDGDGAIQASVGVAVLDRSPETCALDQRPPTALLFRRQRLPPFAMVFGQLGVRRGDGQGLLSNSG